MRLVDLRKRAERLPTGTHQRRSELVQPAHAVLYEPSPKMRCSSLAEMPLRREEISNTARH
jgi:hypothetical protein